MKLQHKIQFSIIPLILIPLLIITMGTCLLAKIYLASIYGGQAQGFTETIANPFAGVNAVVDSVRQEMEVGGPTSVDHIDDPSYLADVNERLERCNAFLIVSVEGEITFRGDEFAAEVENRLPEYGYSDIYAEGVYLETEAGHGFFLRPFDFQFSDGRLGTAYIIARTDRIVRTMRRAMIQLVILLAVVLTVLMLFLSTYIYRTMVKPLKALQEGTERIRDGNLDEDVKVTSADEIGDVCKSFNEMRLKLKESVDDRIIREQESRDLISNISHDLRTPITAIKGYVEGIMDGVADTPEKQDKYLRTIYAKAQEMDSLINELSLYAKIDTNSMPYDFKKISVGDYFDDCAEEMSLDLETQGVAFAYENRCAPGTKMVADPEQLRRILHNICVNGVKYNSKDEKKITLGVRPFLQDWIVISMTDNGDGIEAKDLPLIFNRMYRADAARSNSQGGSGLGLSIARKIVEEHEGKIWAESEPGVGTTISFTVKLWKGAKDE